MRLSKIKLSGFKSFVDSTTVAFPSNLVGIVGPNGCGKSNIIDAVRWVMGESSAKTLRGESITDVIFNGSLARSPVGQASVELFFDNSDSRIGGEYSAFSEISIRRQVNREAQSTYFINNVRCRRRDILSIFSGTGIKSRSYSIIEQGMISRFIEAKPDDLRAFLEEAAGISKYKERRHETENRMQHARENLARVTDLRDELEKQLNHLQRQANAAERFKEYKTQERLLKGQLLAIKYRDIATSFEKFQTTLNQLETRLAEKQAHVQRINTQIENYRELYHDALDNSNVIQEQYYAAGQDITRLEQNIAHEREKQATLQSDYEQTLKALQQAEADFENDNNQINVLVTAAEQLQPQVTSLRAEFTVWQDNLKTAENNIDTWQKQWDEFQESAHKNAQTAQVSQTRIQHYENQLASNKSRAEKINGELSQLNIDVFVEAIGTLQTQLSEATHVQQESDARLKQFSHDISSQRQFNHDLSNKLQAQKQELQKLSAERVSLHTLQQAALGKTDENIKQWLEGRQLSQHQRLAQQLEVESGWELAVESVLGSYLQAVCVSDVRSICRNLSDLPGGQVTFVQPPHAASSMNDTRLLASKLTSKTDVKNLLQGVYAADDLNQALALYDQLKAHESVITKDGLWLSQHWLRVTGQTRNEKSIISREKEINQLSRRIEEAEKTVEELSQQLVEAQKKLTTLESERESQQKRCNENSAAVSDINASLKIKTAQHQQTQHRRDQLSKEIQELNTQNERANNELQSLRQTWSDAMQHIEKNAGQRDTLQTTRASYQQTLAEARVQVQRFREQLHGAEMRLQSNQSQLGTLRNGLNRQEAQINQFSAKKDRLAELLKNERNPIATLQQELNTFLEKRLNIETALKEARTKVQSLEADMANYEDERQEVEKLINEQRTALENQRLEMQSLVVRKQTIVEQLAEASMDLEAINTELPADASAPVWEEQVSELERKIQRLGSINLAAIEEFQETSQRKEYLDAQLKDLQEALDTLESAIRKIDKETRQRFKETYDSVNASFQQLFPKIFNGGSAYLELTSEELLDTGVTVMAQPPGKRNSTIHLLSGGEKALTAIALVFAIFELNPSPFCILDEVDAPLDEANVGRYCRLVSEMSQKVQFIFISHNKVTIEMAEQLIGVTMNEPGVSRLVAVDIKEAVALAEA